MPSDPFPVVLPVAELAELLGTARPERIAGALEVAVSQGVAELRIDAEGRAVVALTAALAERLRLVSNGGRWFTVADGDRVEPERTAVPPPEGPRPTAQVRARPSKARKVKRKSKEPPRPLRNSFDLKALRKRLDGLE